MCFKIAVLGNRKKIFKKRCRVSPCRDFLAHENDLVKCIKKQKRKKKSILKMFKNNWLFQGVHWNLFDQTSLRRYIKVDALDFFMYFFFIVYLNEIHLMYKEVIWIILNYSKNVGEYISMTTLLTHTVAHSTKPSFRPKTNNQPLKKFLSLALS